MSSRAKRFTIYDMMERRGVFDENKNNAASPGYVKADYPKMLYHPEGKTKVLFAGVSERDKYTGETIMVGQQVEIINRIVGNAVEEAEWTAKGWHLHPVEAMRASGVTDLPATSSQARIDELEALLKSTQAELDKSKRSKVAADLASDD